MQASLSLPPDSATPRAMVPISKPWMDEHEAAAVLRPLQSGWVTQGPEVAAFEREFASYVGAAHACAVSNCTTALHLALMAVGVSPGDEVITASHSYIATANSIRYCGATPVFVDIQRHSFNLDPDLIERAISPRTKAILAVHQIGMPCDLEPILDIAHRHALPVIEDAACAIGSEIRFQGRWDKIGRPHGAIACFSFHPRKVVTTGDGGMLTTSNAEWDKQFRLLRQHGMSVPDTVRHASHRVIFESYPVLGFNYRMTDVQAAIGREQLRKLPEIIARRRALADRYAAALGDIDELELCLEPPWARTNWQSYAVRLDAGIGQLRVMQAMLDEGIVTRRGIMCSHLEAAYPDGTWHSAGAGLRESEAAQNEVILLPLFPTMTHEEQDRVAGSLRRAVST